MNILIFSHNSGSSRHGMVFRNAAWAKAWVKQGHNVIIIASSFSHSRSLNPKTKQRITIEWIDGIKFIWVKGNTYSPKSALGRVLSMALYTIQCYFLKLPLDTNYDLVIASSPHPFAIYPAKKYADHYKAKLIYDIRDLWPLTLIELGNISPRHPFIRLMQKAENYACRHADLVTAVPHACENYLLERGLQKNRFIAIGNGIEPEDIQPEPAPEYHKKLLEKLKKENRFLIGYTGTIGFANAIHVLINAMKNTAINCHAILVGRGDEHISAIELLIKENGLQDRVHILPAVNRDQIQDILSYIDAAYVGIRKSKIYQFGASLTKLNDYMLSKKPIIYSGDDFLNAVEQSDCGLLCTPESPESVTSAINQLQSMSQSERNEMGKKGYDWLMNNQIISTQSKQILDRVFG